MLSFFNAISVFILAAAAIMFIASYRNDNPARLPLIVAAHGMSLLLAANWLIAGDGLWLFILGPVVTLIHVYDGMRNAKPGTFDSAWARIGLAGRAVRKYAIGVINAFCAIALFGAFLLLFPELGTVDKAYTASALTEEIGLTREVLTRVAICISHFFIGVGGTLVATGAVVIGQLLAEIREDDQPAPNT